VTEIVHITEAMSSGVLDVVASLCREQTKRGAKVRVFHTRRDITPSQAQLDALLGTGVVRTEVYSGTSTMSALIRLAWATLIVFRQSPKSKVHVHSSKAGLVVRILAIALRRQGQVFYSPHGFAFLREDVPTMMRKAMRVVESTLAKCGGILILCSESEQALARDVLGAKVAVLLENAIDTSSLPLRTDRSRKKPRVVTSGRISAQKAPWRFNALAQQLVDHADFIWIGDGDDSDKSEWLPYPAVTITGWLSRAEVLEELSDSDIFVLLSAWEGMPIALIEAQCVGLPSIVTDIVGNRDVVRHGVTGAVCAANDEITSWTMRLLQDSALRGQMSDNALNQKSRFDLEKMGERSISIYENSPAVAVS
jgi:glycosyltransferase involved in cell wall biosynthesis